MRPASQPPRRVSLPAGGPACIAPNLPIRLIRWACIEPPRRLVPVRRADVPCPQVPRLWLPSFPRARRPLCPARTAFFSARPSRQPLVKTRPTRLSPLAHERPLKGARIDTPRHPHLPVEPNAPCHSNSSPLRARRPRVHASVPLQRPSRRPCLCVVFADSPIPVSSRAPCPSDPPLSPARPRWRRGAHRAHPQDQAHSRRAHRAAALSHPAHPSPYPSDAGATPRAPST